MKKILLTDEVMISDPCYTVPTWCQHKLTNVLPGYYQPFCKLHDAGDWGERNSMLLVIHEDHQFDEDLVWELVEGADIGVDSGQAGIFSMRTYRNDDHSVLQERPKPSGKPGCSWEYGYFNDGSEGDMFYDLMCGLTLNNEDGWGIYDEGVVSRSGFGDGSYNLYVSLNDDGQVIAMCIDFCVEEEEVIDFEFYKDTVN